MTGRPWRHLDALPPYLGGKRRLLPAILATLEEFAPRSSWAQRSMLDAFAGGGAVSLTAKALGFSVHANDLAMRSVIVSKALIENGETRLARRDLLPLFEHAADGRVYDVAGAFLTERQAKFLARAIPAANAASGATRWLLLLVLIKWVLGAMPMSTPAATDAQRAAALDFDAISPNRVASFLRGQASVSPSALWRVAQRVNAGVLPGTGTASRMDAIEFLARSDGHIAFLDPPYPGTTSYEREYALLDSLLDGDHMATSGFSSAAPPLEALLDAAEHVPVWLISFGGRDPEQMVRLVRERRTRVIVHRIPYRHLASLAPERKTYEYVIGAS